MDWSKISRPAHFVELPIVNVRQRFSHTGVRLPWRQPGQIGAMTSTARLPYLRYIDLLEPILPALLTRRDIYMSHLAEQNATGWRAFWNRGGWWRAVLVTFGYLVLFVVASFIIVRLGRSFAGSAGKDVATNAKVVTTDLLLPEIAGALIITIFVASVAWFPKLFASRPRGGSWWMWIAPAAIVVAAVVRLATTDWKAYSTGAVIAILILGLLVGYTEELLARGVNVHLLSKGGYGSRVTMVLSSVLFAAMHSVNAIGGGKSEAVEIIVTIVFAFFFGAAMYLTLVVTGSLVWAMILHAITDPTTFLASGGVDSGTLASGAGASVGVWVTIVYVILFVVAMFALPENSEADSSAQLLE